MKGDFINLQVGNGDWRDYLTRYFEDGTHAYRDIHNGDFLELWFEGKWVEVRYETMFPRGEHLVFLYFDLPDGRHGLQLERNQMRFRWTPR